MKRLNLFLFSLCMALGSLLTLATSCCDPDTPFAGDGTEDTETPGDDTPPVIEMRTGELVGVVYNTAGEPVQGASVSSGTETTVTDGNGFFTFSKVQVANGRTVVAFKKDGYFDVVRSFDFADTDNWQVVLVRKGNGGNTAQATYPASQPKEFNFNGGSVKLPGGQYVDKDGKPYTGNVTTDVLFLDPNDKDFADIMPGGDLAAKSNDGSGDVDQLISYGMVSVTPKDANGDELKFSDGTPAIITITPETGLRDDIPSWVFNPTTGLWEQEGTSEKQGDSYVLTVSNVKWVNLDYPAKRCYMQGKVKDESGAVVQGVRVHVGQVYATTDNNGYYKTFVPINTAMKIKVEASDYSNYSPVTEQIVKSGTAGSYTTCDITLPTLKKVKGTVVSHLAPNNRYSMWLTYNHKTTAITLSDANGSFGIRTPYNYTGTAALNIRTFDGSVFTKNINITGEDIDLGDIVIDEEIIPRSGYMLVRAYTGQVYEEIEMKRNPSLTRFTKYGCQLFEDSLVISYYIKDGYYENWSLTVPGYSADQTQYHNATVSYSYESSGVTKSISATDVSVTVKQDMNMIIVSFANDMAKYYAYKNETNINDQCIIEAKDLEFNIDFRSSKKTFIYKDELPEFAAFLGDKQYSSVIVTEKNKFFDNDVIIEQPQVSRDEMKSLIKMIYNAGFTNANPNQEEFNTQDYYSAKYISGKKVIAINWYKQKMKIEMVENFSSDISLF